MWIDRSGAAVAARTSAGDALAVSAITAGVVIAAGVSIACLWEIVRRCTLACNCAAWAREWRAVAPVWSRGEGRRG